MTKAVFLLSLTLVLSGCHAPAPQPFSPSEAHQKLLQIIKEENQLDVVTREFGHTLWIYLPIERSFLEMKAKPEPAMGASAEAQNATTIYFLDGAFTDGVFRIRYDIGPAKQYAKDPGYTSAFSEEYQNNQRNILAAVSRAYADFEPVPGEDALRRRVPGDVDFLGAAKNASHKQMVHDHVKTERAPLIFVLVMADIKNGLEARVTFHLNDLLRAYIDQTFHEEYNKRVISDQPVGDPAIIGDRAGAHVGFREIPLGEFLVEQMVYRVQFKYTRSAFPPTGSPREEILRAAAETVGAYDFTDFSAVALADLHAGTSEVIEKEALTDFHSTPSRGRLIHLRFQ